MATVTGFTAERMQEVIDETIVDAEVQGDDLILIRHDGVEINAGNVRGAIGPSGDISLGVIRSLADHTVALWELEAKVLSRDLGLEDWQGEAFVPYHNRIESFSKDGSNHEILGVNRDIDRNEGWVAIRDHTGPDAFQDAFGAVAGGATAMAATDDGQWVFFGSGTTIKAYAFDPVNKVFENYSSGLTLQETSSISLAVNIRGGSAISVSPDRKALIVAVDLTPFIYLVPFNATTGVLGTPVAITTPNATSSTVGSYIAWHPTSAWVAIATTTDASTVEIWAVNTTTGLWGAKATNPVVPGTGRTVYSVAFHPSGNFFFIQGAGTIQLMHAYAFNPATGATSGASQAPLGGATNMRGLFKVFNDLVISSAQGTPYIHVWNWNTGSGIWGTKWADPAVVTPLNSFLSHSIASVSPDKKWIAYNFASGNSLWLKISLETPNQIGNPVDFFNFVPFTATPKFPALTAHIVIPWTWNGKHDFLVLTQTTSHGTQWVDFHGRNVILLGEYSGTDELSGSLVTDTKVLDADVTHVYILDDFVGDTGVTRTYDVSTDGGGTWALDVPLGVMALVDTGNDLKVRLNMTRSATGKSGYIYWFTVFGG